MLVLGEEEAEQRGGLGKQLLREPLVCPQRPRPLRARCKGGENGGQRGSLQGGRGSNRNRSGSIRDGRGSVLGGRGGSIRGQRGSVQGRRGYLRVCRRCLPVYCDIMPMMISRPFSASAFTAVSNISPPAPSSIV
eukprot:1185391-Prorocentrum_minimum.AAC.3